MMKKQLYAQNTANYPRLSTDTFFADYGNQYQYNGFIDRMITYIEEFQLLRRDLWRRFVQQFREDADFDNGWKGEYWGKMMRGACLTYSYTRDRELYQILTETVSDMMDSQEKNGRISSYGVSHEFQGWDMWARKYVLLGMQYYLEICEDPEFAKQVIACMCGQADYILAKVGPKEEGKTPINACSGCWRGMNASSILEPFVRLYSITGKKRYLDFAGYIVECGGSSIENIFELAYEDELYPYQYPLTKAYEMISCFEGLLEYYRVTGIETYKTAVINFANKILESDFTVIGSCGCTHELFDHSRVRQANTTNGIIAQETCVTVTLMKFLYQVLLVTGDPRYADAFEISMYNAYFGAVNTEKAVSPLVRDEHPDWVHEPLPFDSYSPLTSGIRGRAVGGLQVMSDKHYYGCCACIGSAGNGLIPKMQLMTTSEGFAWNLFVDGTVHSHTPAGNSIGFQTKTEYPGTGHVQLVFELEENESFEFMIRIPYWSKNTQIKVNGESVPVEAGYTALNREWKNADTVELELDMRTEAIRPIAYGHEILMNKVVWDQDYVVPVYDKEDPIAAKHLALRRGPVMLAQENRLGYCVDHPVRICVGEDGFVDVRVPQKEIAPYPHLVEVSVPLEDGESMEVTDYASAGKLWTEESKMAVWMLTAE